MWLLTGIREENQGNFPLAYNLDEFSPQHKLAGSKQLRQFQYVSIDASYEIHITRTCVRVLTFIEKIIQ